MSPWVSVLLAGVLILINGFFVAAEFALVKVRSTQLEPMRGTKRGDLALKMLDNIDAYLSASQLGITLASLALGWIGEPAFAWIFESMFGGLELPEPTSRLLSVVLAFVTITALHIVIGEQAPKAMAIRRPRRTSVFATVPLYVFYIVTYPAIWLLNGMANGFLMLFGVKPAREGELAVSEEEIRQILADEHESRLTEEKRELLDNVFELSDRIARHVMVPRSEVVFLDIMLSVEENLETARASGHTRFPLCEEDLDHVLGIVHIKDLFRANNPPAALEDVRRDTFFVPETQSLDEVLRRMRTERIHMAAVLDEYGGISGIITLENIIEEIVGEIQDEFDYELPEVVKESEGVFEVQGSTLIRDLEDVIGVDIASGEREEDTVAGAVLSELGRRGQVGDKVDVGPLSIVVREIDHNRIAAVQVTVKDAMGEELEEKVVEGLGPGRGAL